jgi:hypothetical protein
MSVLPKRFGAVDGIGESLEALRVGVVAEQGLFGLNGSEIAAAVSYPDFPLTSLLSQIDCHVVTIL